MTVGYSTDKGQVDAISGQVSRQIEAWAPDALKMKAWLDTMSDEQLQMPPYAYTADDVALLKSSFNDLALLANIYYGKETLTEARDLGVFARRLAGLFI